MTPFESNIISIYGEKGKAWLNGLHELVAHIATRLSLHDLKPVPNLSYNYVLSGFQSHTPIILKLSLDNEGTIREAFALRCFAQWGAVRVLAAQEGMLLLERAVPGTSLKSYFPDKEMEAVHIACKVMKKLHQAKIPEGHKFPHMRDWLSALDKDFDIPSNYLQKAKKLRDQLLQDAGPDLLLHGDLHHDNILHSQHSSTSDDEWMVIDPKGVIGEAAYEVATFMRNPIPDLLSHPNAIEIIQNRIATFARILNISPNRISDWCFVQSLLAWIWALEDGCDRKHWEGLVHTLQALKA
jgi:streptomycin 6-kinase